MKHAIHEKTVAVRAEAKLRKRVASLLPKGVGYDEFNDRLSSAEDKVLDAKTQATEAEALLKAKDREISSLKRLSAVS